MNTFALQTLAGKSALLVNDNPFDGIFLEGLLDQAEIKLAIAGSATEATRMMAEQVFDFLLVDLQSIGDGLAEFIQNSSLARVRNAIRVIGITSEKLDVATAEQLELDALISKPIEPDQFFDKLAENRVLEKAPEFDLPETDLINIREGLMRLGGNKEAYARVLELFVNNQRNVPGDILLAMKAGDLKLAERLAHTIKGVAGNVGATRVQDAALPLEQAFKRGDVDEASHLLRELEKRFVKVLKVVDEWLAARQGITEEIKESAPENKRIDMDGACQLLEQLGKSVDARRPVECEPLLKKLMQLDWPGELEEGLNELNRLSRSYRYRQARILLDSLLRRIWPVKSETFSLDLDDQAVP